MVCLFCKADDPFTEGRRQNTIVRPTSDTLLNVTFSLLVAALLAAPLVSAQPLQKLTINFPARTGSNWPLFIAKEGGYYQKYGLDVTLVFGVHPAGIAMLVNGDAAMTNYTLEQTMQASVRDGSFVFVGSPFKKSLFAMMAAKNFSSVKDLKGKRIAVSQIGDAPYNYAVGLLATAGMTPRDVQWVPVGTDVNGRAAALVAGPSGRHHAHRTGLLQAGAGRVQVPRQYRGL